MLLQGLSQLVAAGGAAVAAVNAAQFCGNFLDGTVKGKKGIAYGFRAAVCLETQKYPDTPNKPEWPSAVLRPGEKYESRCIYKFSVDE